MDGINTNQEFNLYEDISQRTNGEMYLGIVGPVRTGKSTFIKRFMDICVLPYMTKKYEKQQAMDELPQSASGKTITTTEPKFVPKDAAQISLENGMEIMVKLIDCVGYMVNGASGHMEENVERMVKTPWFDQEIPFTKAAEIGTKKVINDHSTIGIVITTDGSFTDISRESYKDAEEKTIEELKSLNKPFIVVVNSTRPYSAETKQIADEITEKHGVSAIAMNLEQLKKEDIHLLLQSVLSEFPIKTMEFFVPKWVEMLENDNQLKNDMVVQLQEKMNQYKTMKDIKRNPFALDLDCVKRVKVDEVLMSNGSIKIYIDIKDEYYYEMLSKMLGQEISSEYELLNLLKEYSSMRGEYEGVLQALESVRMKGYGVITPNRDEIKLEQPEVIKHGNKYGVKIKAESPSIHLIKANIETEIAPIVGTKEQAEDLIQYIGEGSSQEDGVWDTNIFGKTVEQLVNDGISGKISMIGDESQIKLQETMQKIVNDTNGGLICIII